MVSSLHHGKAVHTGPTSRASPLFQTDVSTLVLPSHSVKEERAVLPHTYQAQILLPNLPRTRTPYGATYPGRRDAMCGCPEGCYAFSAVPRDQVKNTKSWRCSVKKASSPISSAPVRRGRRETGQLQSAPYSKPRAARAAKLCIDSRPRDPRPRQYQCRAR